MSDEHGFTEVTVRVSTEHLDKLVEYFPGESLEGLVKRGIDQLVTCWTPYDVLDEKTRDRLVHRGLQIVRNAPAYGGTKQGVDERLEATLEAIKAAHALVESLFWHDPRLLKSEDGRAEYIAPARKHLINADGALEEARACVLDAIVTVGHESLRREQDAVNKDEEAQQ